jgi:hypothetical protein
MSKTRSYRPRAVVPCLERLESRDQPTATVTQTGGALSIIGSDLPDVIRIGDDGQGNIAVLITPFTTAQVFHNVSSINVQTFGGPDSVRYDLVGTFSGTRGIHVNLGTGSKDFQFYTNNNELLPNANLTVSATAAGGGTRQHPASTRLLASTGADPDQATVNLFTQALGLTLFTPFQNGILRFGPHTGTDIALGAHLGINLSAGTGDNNVVSVTYQGIVLGSLSVNEQGTGGPKRDTVTGQIDLFGGTTGTVNANVAVSPGRDTISLRIREIGFFFTPTINGTLDGGPLKSVTTRTSNVNVLNSFKDTIVNIFA